MQYPLLIWIIFFWTKWKHYVTTWQLIIAWNIRHNQTVISWQACLFMVYLYVELITSKLDSKTVPVLPSLMFHFDLLLPSMVHHIGFSLHFFPGFHTIFISLSSNNILHSASADISFRESRADSDQLHVCSDFSFNVQVSHPKWGGKT